jgi:hypothetical protein
MPRRLPTIRDLGASEGIFDPRSTLRPPDKPDHFDNPEATFDVRFQTDALSLLICLLP